MKNKDVKPKLGEKICIVCKQVLETRTETTSHIEYLCPGCGRNFYERRYPLPEVKYNE